MRLPLVEARFGRAVQPLMVVTLRDGVSGVSGLSYDSDLRLVRYERNGQTWITDAAGADMLLAPQPEPPATPQPEQAKRPDQSPRAGRR